VDVQLKAELQAERRRVAKLKEEMAGLKQLAASAGSAHNISSPAPSAHEHTHHAGSLTGSVAVESNMGIAFSPMTTGTLAPSTPATSHTSHAPSSGPAEHREAVMEAREAELRRYVRVCSMCVHVRMCVLVCVCSCACVHACVFVCM
jgi:hypothetical protein